MEANFNGVITVQGKIYYWWYVNDGEQLEVKRNGERCFKIRYDWDKLKPRAVNDNVRPVIEDWIKNPNKGVYVDWTWDDC